MRRPTTLHTLKGALRLAGVRIAQGLATPVAPERRAVTPPAGPLHQLAAGVQLPGGARADNKAAVVSHATLEKLARTDPVTWSLIRTVRQLIAQAPWQVVPDVGDAYKELDRWEDQSNDSVNDWGYAVEFESALLTPDVVGRIGAELKGIIKPGTPAPKQGADSSATRDKRRQIASLFRVAKRQLEQEAIVAAARVRPVFERPNDDLEKSWRALMELVVGDLLLDDAGILIKNYTVGGALAELWTVPGYQVRPILYPDYTVPRPPSPAYLWDDGGKVRGTFSNAELTYLMANPTHSGYGMSPVEALVWVITASILGDAKMIESLNEGMLPPGILNLKDASEVQRDRFADTLYSQMQRTGGNRITVVSGVPSENGEFQWLELPRGIDFQKLQMAEYSRLSPGIKALAFGFQADDLGLVMDAAKGKVGDADVLQVLSQRRGILGPMTLIEEYVNAEIVRAEFPGCRVRFQFEKASGAMPDVLKEAQARSVYVAAGILDRNEVRDDMKRRPIPGGNTATMATGNALIPVETLDGLDMDVLDPSMLPGMSGGANPADPKAGTSGNPNPAPKRNNANQRAQTKGHESRG